MNLNSIKVTSAWSFDPRNFTATYTNNRRSGGYGSGTNTFDVAGNITMNDIYEGPGTTNRRNWKFDAAGRVSDWYETLPEAGNYVRDEGAILTFDGDGRAAKRLNRVRSRLNNTDPGWVEEAEYTIFSSVTGQKITTLTQTGGKATTYIYLGNSKIAAQSPGIGNSNVNFQFSDPLTGSEIVKGVSGDLRERKDIGALGTVVPEEEPEEFPMPDYKEGGSVGNPEFGCAPSAAPIDCNDEIDYYVDGFQVTRRNFHQAYRAGAIPAKRYSGFGYWEDYDDPRHPEGGAVITRYYPLFNLGQGLFNFERVSLNPPLDDCQMLVAIVEMVANVSSNETEFMQRLIDVIFGSGEKLEATKTDDLERANNLGAAVTRGDTGFKTQFLDGSDQVRHFVGGLWAGFLYGSIVGNLGMNNNENNRENGGRGSTNNIFGILSTLFPTTTGLDKSAPDVALNGESTALGASLKPTQGKTETIGGGRNGRRSQVYTPGTLGYKGLAQIIRKRICE